MAEASEQLIAEVRAYLGAIERGDLEAMRGLCHPEAVQVEYPNRLKAKGDRRGLEKMSADFERGRQLLETQRYEIESATASGSMVAVRVLWTGVLAAPLGALKAGAAMRAHSAIFFEFREGRILRQFNYDCFEDFSAAA